MARHAVMLERLMPIYEAAAGALAVDVMGLPRDAKLDANKRKLAAAKVLPELRAVMFPDDADG